MSSQGPPTPPPDCQVTDVGLLPFYFPALISVFPHFHSCTQNVTKNVLCKLVKPHLTTAGVNQTDEAQDEKGFYLLMTKSDKKTIGKTETFSDKWAAGKQQDVGIINMSNH